MAELAGSATNKAVKFIRVAILVFDSAKITAKEEALITLGDVFGTELLAHDIKESFAMCSTESLRASIFENVTIFTESVSEALLGGGGKAVLEAGLFGNSGTAVRGVAPSVFAVFIQPLVRRAVFKGAFEIAISDDAVKVGGFEFTTLLTAGEVVLEAGTGHDTVVMEMPLATKCSMGAGPTAGGGTSGIGKFVESATDTTESSVGHFEERDREDEWHDLNSETEKDEDWVFVGSRDNSPTGKFRGAVKEAEHGVKEEHLSEESFPLLEPFFGIGEEIKDEGKWRNHDKDEDDTLAKTDCN